MRNRKIFERLFPETQKMGMSFKDFVSVYERTDFGDVDKTNLNDIYLWGDDSSLFDDDKSLMQALNIDTENELVMAKVAKMVPPYTGYFSADKAKTTKGIDLVIAQIEYMKSAVTSFENSLISSITGEEEAEQYKSPISALRVAITKDQIKAQLIEQISLMLRSAVAGPSDSNFNVDQFVETDEGKQLIEILDVLGVSKSSSTIIDDVTDNVIGSLKDENMESVETIVDELDLEEINSKNIDPKQILDYMKVQDIPITDVLKSMNPLVRLGAFYQMCFQQQKEFFDTVMEPSQSYSEDTIRIIYGKDLDVNSVRPIISKIDQVLTVIINSKWDQKDSIEIKTAIFTPILQSMYISMLNFVLMKGLYTFLTKKTKFVKDVRARKEEEAKKAATSLKPSNMSDSERAKIISKTFKNPKLQELLDDNTIYIAGRKNYDPDKVKALKELVYYSFGGPESPYAAIKNWDTTKNPLDGNYDTFFSELIREIQTDFKIPPIRDGKGDGKVGPNTKDFLKEITPSAIAELLP